MMHSEPGQKLIDLSGPHIARVLHLLKTNEVTDPVPVGFFGTDAVMIHADNRMNLVPQTRLFSFHSSWLPANTVYLYSIIGGVDHRCQMITWKGGV